MARGIRIKFSSVIHNCTFTDMKWDILEQWKTMCVFVYFKRLDKNRLRYIRIWTMVFPRCTVSFAGGGLTPQSPVGVWCSIVPVSYLKCRAYPTTATTPPPPPSLPRTPVPFFRARPKRRMQHCLKYCKWDTKPHRPSKNRKIGFNRKMNILFCLHSSMSKMQSKPV